MTKAAALALVALALGGAAPAPVATFRDFSYEGHQPAYQRVKAGPGKYLNPILAGSRSDPTIVRVGTDYYLSNTSFGYWPGTPIWHSRDLVHWRIVSHAITSDRQLDLSRIDPGWQGIWANDLKYHDGWFYSLGICYACGGVYVTRARDVRGPWSVPTMLKLDSIDPSIFFDDDGRAYIVHNAPPPAGSPPWDGHRALWLREFDLKTMALVGEPTLLVDGGTHPPAHPFWIEGPHLFRKDGRYYLIAAQGGTNERHSEVVFRADSLRGPYVAGPDPIPPSDGLDPARPDPVANAGHADFVQTPAGDWWAVFLGARPYTGGPLAFASGRETFLLPVTWRDGWPSVVREGQPVPLVGKRPRLADAPLSGWPTAGDYRVVDRFTSKALAPEWSFTRSGPGGWWRTGGGALAIEPRPIEFSADHGQPSFVALRQAHMDATVEVSVSFAAAHAGDRAGLAMVQDPRRWYFLAVAAGAGGGRELRLMRRNGNADPAGGVLMATAPLAGGSGAVGLRIAATGPTCRFAYRPAGSTWRSIGGEQDATILNIRTARGFSGVMIGMAAITNPSDPRL